MGYRRQRGWDFGVAVDVMIVAGDLKFKPFIVLIVAERQWCFVVVQAAD
jgi:hypothetical protein